MEYFRLMEPDGASDYYCGCQSFISFWKLLNFFYPRWEYAVALTSILFIVAGSNEVIAYHSGTVVGKFYKALVDHNENQFWTVFYQASLIYIGQTLVIALVSLCSWLLAVSLRRNLVSGLHRLYFQRHVYYNINAIQEEGIDNPDQRITQDAEKMTTLLATKILPYLIIAPGVIAYYTVKTWQQAGWVGVACIYGYFLVGTVVNRIIVSPITKWTARLERAEGDFRYKHVSVRNNAEESAFYEAHNFEHTECNRFIDVLLFIQARLAMWKFPAQYFQTFFDYYGGVLTYAIQVIPVFLLKSYSGYSPGDLAQQISNNAFFFMYLINSFTRLTDLAMSIGELAGYTQRLSSLIDVAQRSQKEEWSKVPFGNGEHIFKLDNISFSSSSSEKRSLISNLSIDITTLETLLITGTSGVGKTSLFRVLKQLWKPSSGDIQRYLDVDQVMFLPQKSYLPVGNLSLKQQLFFPRFVEDEELDRYEDTSILNTLDLLGLGKLVSYTGSLNDLSDFEWQDVLSPGEQQRLSIARVLLRKPKVVVLDEATSCLGEDAEKIVYGLLKQSGIHYISIGHRSSLFALHDQELHLKQADAYVIRDIPHPDEKSVHSKQQIQ